MIKNKTRYYHQHENVSSLIDLHQKYIDNILLNNGTNSFSEYDFTSLISKQSSINLEKLVQLSQKITKERFGSTIQIFAPLYLSNECQNICTYCGFSLSNKIPRKTLTDNEILKEIHKRLKDGDVLLGTAEKESEE